jgi:two-component system cell cycle response regulator
VNALGTILIADDSAVIRAVVRQQLEDEGYAVVEADDGFAAITTCKREQPDAVLLDIEMPGLDGREVLSRIKGDPGIADIPVVFLTGRTATDDLVGGLRAGAHDYLKKPFDTAELIARISGAVRIKQLQDELRKQNAELERVARVDALTEVYNRRHLQESLTRLGAASRRDGWALSAILFDVDHFKSVNDTHGHSVGDQVLQHCARRIVDTVRAGAIVGRWGGEEFLVILPGVAIDEAAMAAERVRAAIAGTPVQLSDRSLTVTASGGCAETKDGDTDSLLLRADVALYRAKEAGRNRVVTA